MAAYYAPYKKLLTANLTSTFFVSVLALALPMIVRHIMGTIIGENMGNIGNAEIIGQIIQAALVMLAIIVSQTGFSIYYDYKGHDMGAKIERDMRGQLFEHYQKLDFSFYDNQKIGQLISRISNDLNNLAEMMHHTPENIVIHGIQFIGAFVILFVINPNLALVICVPLVMLFAYSFPFYKKMQGVKWQSRLRLGEVSNFVQENLSGIKVVKSFANEQAEINKFKQENAAFYTSLSQIYKYEAFNFAPIENFFQPLVTVVIVAAGGIWITQGYLNIADLLIFIMYAAYLTAPIPRLAFMVEQVQDGLIGFERFKEIIAIEPKVQDSPTVADLQVSQYDIHFRDVAFRYNDDTELVLNGINLHVKAGETIAVIGQSGIGKTTLCSLVPRFYDICAGEILIGGVNIQNVKLQSLREHIGVVRQETFLFAGTIMQNILYGDLAKTEEDAIAAAKKANAHDFIMKLPNGYHTDIGQRGVKLSGGQQQRLSIARLFLKNPPILILDEATSSLDYKSEQEVMKSLNELAKGRTTFIIAHRLSTIENADRIIELQEVGIVEKK
ncbi:MAG: ABC transporter ATP-binding protein/permease [Firmicutes bacterium]|nr:ABC transporter ATP-binding protein/permease [Bacillota bacterium]